MRTASRTARAALREAITSRRSQPMPATMGDHAAIENLLATVYHRSSPTEFQVQREDPFYEPSDRSVVKDGDQIVGHIRQASRTMRFGEARWPFGRLNYLAVLPEFRSRGVANDLVRFAEQRMREAGFAVGELQTSETKVAIASGWIPCGGRVFSEASARDVLSQLALRCERSKSEVLAPVRKRSKRLSVRLWRHVELPAVMRIYQANLNQCFGALDRSEDYWRWLIGRHAFDHIFVAIEGRDRLALEDGESGIVGYAVVRDRHILEMFTDPEHPTVAIKLLGRACTDAIEQDHHAIRFHGPPDHPIHDLVSDANGGYFATRPVRGTTTFVKILNPPDFARFLSVDLLARLQTSELEVPVELGMCVDGEKWHLTVDARGATMKKGKLGRSYVTCDTATWTSLLLSCVDAKTAIDAGRLLPSTSLAAVVVQTLFSRDLMWRPPWDHLPA
ncbi:MAG: GNAT family N-acetyltransferase [Pirellulales bacterium]|nr:GNAT family N-acetyltransferase [Pirellulales bacterium]